MSASPHGSLRDDAGLTLVEVIVYGIIAALILAGVASVFVAGLRSQAQTTDRDNATGRAQLVSESMQASFRNATAFTATDTLVRARVATGATTFECRAWALSGGKLVYRTSSTAIPAGSYAGWTVLASGVTGTLTGSVPFRATGTQLQVGFAIAVGDVRVPIAITTSPQAKSETAGTACW